jgi:extracellular elastinolytic metalloproteinase
MVASRISAAVALLAAVAGVYGVPWPSSSKHSTHQAREVKAGEFINSYHPASTFETFGEGIAHPLAKRAGGSTPEEAALAFLEAHLGLSNDSFSDVVSSKDSVTKHIYVKQKLNKIPVVNAVANVAINNADKVVSYGASFVKPKSVASATPKITSEAAIAAAESTLAATRVVDAPAPVTRYFITDADHAVLTWVVHVETADLQHYYQAYVDAATGKVVSVSDFVAQLTYHALPIQKQAPTEGFEDIVNPEESSASPNGWSTSGATTGNNVVAYKSSTSGTATLGTYIFDASQGPTATVNLNAAKVNAFYVANKIHDVAYLYGFNEASFNFQNDNFSKGGKGNDAVKVSVQDASGTNNANFATPADGSPGQMRMFTWTFTTPNRDGDLENDIISHEYTHGISNRLTGGGTATCLQTTEAGGMGEGWSDAMADWLEQKTSTVVDFTLGSYVYTKGIRTKPYSTSSTTNSLTYASVGSLNEVHNIGEVWANTLHNVLAGLVAANGYSSDYLTNPNGTGGNTIFMKLFIASMKLQPCNPTMVSARAAWIQADANLFGGANACTLWRAFASKGLGTGAVGGKYTNNNAVPSGC